MYLPTGGSVTQLYIHENGFPFSSGFRSLADYLLLTAKLHPFERLQHELKMKEAKSFLILSVLSHGESLRECKQDLKLSLEHWKGKSSRQMFGYLLFLSSLLHGMNRQKAKMKQVHREVTKGWNEVVWNEVVME